MNREKKCKGIKHRKVERKLGCGKRGQGKRQDERKQRQRKGAFKYEEAIYVWREREIKKYVNVRGK